MWSETVGLRTRPVWDQKNRSWSWSCTLWSWSWSWSCRFCVVLWNTITALFGIRHLTCETNFLHLFAFLVSRPPQSARLHRQALNLLLNRWFACLTGSSILVLKLTFSPHPFPRNLPLSLSLTDWFHGFYPARVLKSLALKTLVSAADYASSAGFWAHFNIVTYLLTYFSSTSLVSLFCAWNITTVEINSNVHLVKSYIRQVPFVYFRWSWYCKQRPWSWSCYIGLGLKNLVLFTSLPDPIAGEACCPLSKKYKVHGACSLVFRPFGPHSAASCNSLHFPQCIGGLDKNTGSAHFRSQRMHQNAGFCIKNIQKFPGVATPGPPQRKGRHLPDAGAPPLLLGWLRPCTVVTFSICVAQWAWLVRDASDPVHAFHWPQRALHSIQRCAESEILSSHQFADFAQRSACACAVVRCVDPLSNLRPQCTLPHSA